MREQQALDRQERADWREAQKRQVEFRMAQLQAEDKKRAEELQAEREKRADESHIKIQIAQIEALKEQDKIDKELKIKEMELQTQQAQAQATASSATTPPPRNKDAKSPKLPSFIDGKGRIRQLPATL